MPSEYKHTVIDVWYGDAPLMRASSPKVIDENLPHEYNPTAHLWANVKSSEFLKPEEITWKIERAGDTALDPSKLRVQVRQGSADQELPTYDDVTDQHPEFLPELVALLSPKTIE